MNDKITITKQNSEIIKFLQKNENINTNILGCLRNNADADVMLFDNNLDNGIIVRAEVYYGDLFFIATDNEDFLGQFWAGLPRGHAEFSGVYQPFADLFLRDKEVLWSSPCKTFVFNGDTVPFADCPYPDEALQQEDAEEVDEYYTYKHDHSLLQFRKDIACQPSSCIRINGVLASWCLVHSQDGSMGPLYTKEEFRGQGLGKITGSRLMAKVLAEGQKPFLQISQSNDAALDLVEKMGGMAYSHDCMWFGIEKL